MNKGALVRLVCTESGVESKQVGRIDIYPGFSYFEVDDTASSKILPKLESGTYEKKTFNVEISKEKELPRKKDTGKRRRY